MIATARLVSCAALAVSASQPIAAAPDMLALIASLAREAPASIAFVEVRYSSLLREPLIVSGTLAYGGPGHLERQVTNPYLETTTVRGGSVLIQREEENPRTLALRRAPELQSFLNAFGAILAGDAASLEQSFDVVASGDASIWELELTPTEPRTLRRVQAIVVHGRDDDPHCVATFDTQGGASVLLLGAAAVAPHTPLDELLVQCRAE